MKTRFTLFLGGYPLAAALLLVVGLLALRVQAQTTGDFRTSATGANFVVAAKWESYNGTAWVAAGAAPTSSDGMITIRAGHTATVGGAVTLDQLTVRGVLSISSGITLTIADGTGTDLTIQDGGTLTQVGTGSIDGAGSFLMEARGMLNIAHANGLAAIGVTGGKTFTAGGYYTFNGTVAQNTGFASATVGDPYTIRIANTAGVTLDQNLTIANALNINLNAVFAIGAGVSSFTAGSIYSRGTINNCVGATISPAFETSGWASPKGTYNDNTSTEPTTEASALYVCPNKTTAHIYWTNGNGRRRVVVLKAGSAIDVNALTDGTTYTANAALGSGTAVDGGSVLYDGVGNQVNVTGLADGVTYHVAVFEYNGNTLCSVSPNYKLGSPLASSFLAEEKPFITTWQTTAAGESITIPVAFSTTYACSVDWGDGSPVGSFSGISPVISHTYAVAGTYTVKITGTFPQIYFNNTGNRTKIQSIEQWGSTAWTSMANAFYGCTNLRHNATDTPNFYEVSDMAQMFRGCSSTSFNGTGGMNHWNTGAVINMSYMFNGATAFNLPIGNWNTAAVTSMSNMFAQAAAFNQPIGSWNTAAVTSMYYMLLGTTVFNQPIGSWNTAAVTDMGLMLYQATAFNQPVGSWNTAAVTSLSGVFYQATTFNQPVDNWNTAAVTNFLRMFLQTTSFNQPISSWNTAAATDMNQMFQNATAFNQLIGSWQLNPNVTMANMLSSCGMNRTNYEATLAGWAAQSVTGRSLGASGLQYCDPAGRNTLTTTKSWTITGDVLDCSFYYRTAGNTTFAAATNWEKSEKGTLWSAAASAPDATATTNAITIQNGHTATVDAGITLDQLTVKSGGTLQVATGTTLTLADGTGTDLTIQNGGTLDIQGTGTLAGGGSFILDAGGIFKTAHANGVSGSVIVTGGKTFTAGANYVFNGTAAQSTGFPTMGGPANITIDNTNTASGVTLTSSVPITGTFLVNASRVVTFNNTNTVGGTGAFTLSAGATLRTAHANGVSGSVAVTGTKTFTAGANYVFNGTAAQNTGFPTIGNPANITIDNTNTASGVTLNGSVTITGTFLVNSNRIVTFNSSNTVGGTGAFTLSAGATLRTAHANGLSGSVTGAGTKTFTSGANYVFNGAALQTINNPSGLIANNVTISNASGADLSNNLTINGTLALTSGPLRTGSSKLTLGSGASVSGETGTNYVIGMLESSRTVNGSTVNFGDMGVTINATTSGNNLGAVTVTRKAGVSTLNTSYIQNGGGTKSIDRIWTISPATQPTTSVDVTLSWLTANDNGISDFSAAQIWKSSDGGATWQPVGSTQNASASRSITATFTGFSSITVGGTGASFPVEWLSFEATPTASAVLLDWTTGSEQNNAAFSVERSEDGRIFAEIGTVVAAGNSTTPTAYSYADAALPAGVQTLHYRLRQTDMDGVSTLSETRTVQRQRHTGVSVAPNPTTGVVQVSGLSVQVAEIQVFTAAGQRLYTMPTDGKAALGIDLSAQPAGVYLLRAGAATFRVVRQ